MKCSVCDNLIAVPLYESASDLAVTSLAQIAQMKTRVWLCEHCSHLNTDPMPDQQGFYEFDYQISIGSDDEDQVYEVRGDRITFRGDHQAHVFGQKVALSHGARVLDFGCAKASMMRRLKVDRPDAQIYLFDVSRSYEGFWKTITPPENQAVHDMPDSWTGSFDLVTSYFSLEHIPDPVQAMEKVHSLLTPAGVLYAVVPYTLTNIADFIVVDHVSHFTVASLDHLLRRVGFVDIDIDADAHRGALIVKASKSGDASSPVPVSREIGMARQLTDYWRVAGERLRTQESLSPNPTAAIYGAGFYGTYVISTLAKPERIACFLDRSPFLNGKTVFGKPVIAPRQLDPGIQTLYVAVNPSVASSVVSGLRDEGHIPSTLIFLEPFSWEAAV